MIKFEGTLSETCCKFFMRVRLRYILKTVLLVDFLFLLPLFIFGILSRDILLVFPSGLLILLLNLLFIHPEKKNYGKLMANKITIWEHGGMEAKTETFSENRTFDDIKYIVDFGEGYFIYFVGLRQSLSFLCQKDLIKEGSIEKFEQLFEGRIQRI